MDIDHRMLNEQSGTTRFGKERMKLYSMFFPPSLVEEIDAKRGLVDRSTWIRDKLFHILSGLEYESKSGLGKNRREIRDI